MSELRRIFLGRICRKVHIGLLTLIHKSLNLFKRCILYIFGFMFRKRDICFSRFKGIVRLARIFKEVHCLPDTAASCAENH